MTLGFMQNFPWGNDWYNVDGTPRQGKLYNDGKCFTDLNGQNYNNYPVTKLKGAPTYFREKILLGAGYGVIRLLEGKDKIVKPSSIQLQAIAKIGNINPKLHTLRADPHDRWKAGRKIEMVYRGAGYKILSHFNKGIPELEKCVSTQKVEIKYGDKKVYGFYGVIVAIDGRILNEDERRVLAINDGFDSLDHFYRWFNKDFTGKILHFSNLRY